MARCLSPRPPNSWNDELPPSPAHPSTFSLSTKPHTQPPHTYTQTKIDNVGGEPLRRARDAVTKLGKKIADTQASAAKKGAQLKAGGKQLEKLKKDAAKAGGFGGAWKQLPKADGKVGRGMTATTPRGEGTFPGAGGQQQTLVVDE
jgi:hypothetical protein